MKPSPLTVHTVLSPPVRTVRVEPARPGTAATTSVEKRPAAAVLQRHSGFGQLSLDLRRGG